MAANGSKSDGCNNLDKNERAIRFYQNETNPVLKAESGVLKL